MGGGSRINTVASTEESSIRVFDATYGGSTLMSDHHYPLLVRYQVPGIRVAKPEAECVPRLKESHMPPVRLTVSQGFKHACAVDDKPRGDPVKDSRGYIERLQMALYKWAKETNNLKVRKFDGAGLEARPAEETKRDIEGKPMTNSRDMLLHVAEFVDSLPVQLSKPKASERQLKLELIRIATQVARETTETADRNRKRVRAEGDATGPVRGSVGVHSPVPSQEPT